LTFSLTIDAKQIAVTADFGGEKRKVDHNIGAIDAKGQTIVIYPTILNEYKMINVSGIESAAYTIYTPNGYVVRTGFFESGKISAIELGAGSYILSIEGQMARFIVN
jgi:hypothetical protein